MVCVGSNLKVHPVPTPAVSRDSFHQIRLFPVLGQALTFWAHGMTCAGGRFQVLGGFSEAAPGVSDTAPRHTLPSPWAPSCSLGQGLDLGQEGCGAKVSLSFVLLGLSRLWEQLLGSGVVFTAQEQQWVQVASSTQLHPGWLQSENHRIVELLKWKRP